MLTLLVHLGYLTYEEVPDPYDDDDDQVVGLARIPNEEVRTLWRESGFSRDQLRRKDKGAYVQDRFCLTIRA